MIDQEITGQSEILVGKLLKSKLKTSTNLFLQLSNAEGQTDFRDLDGLLFLWQNVCVCCSFFSIVSAFYMLTKKGNFELHNLLQDLKLFFFLYAMAKHFVLFISLSKTQSVRFHYP